LLTMAIPVAAAAGLMRVIHRYGERRTRAMILAIPKDAPVADPGV
jgi:hypothetical protein